MWHLTAPARSSYRVTFIRFVGGFIWNASVGCDELIFKQLLHALDLLQCLFVAVWIREAWGTQLTQLTVDATQLSVQILAFVSVLLNHPLCRCWISAAIWKCTYIITWKSQGSTWYDVFRKQKLLCLQKCDCWQRFQILSLLVSNNHFVI